MDRLSADEEADEYTAKQEAGYLNDHEGEWPQKEPTMGTIERRQLQEQLGEKLRAELAAVALPADDKLSILEGLADEVAAEASTDTHPAQSIPHQRVEGSGSWVGEMRVQEPLRIDFSIATAAASDKPLAPAGVVKGE